MKQTNLSISGMTCSACSARIEKSMKRLNGVENIEVNLISGKAKIIYDDNELKLDDLSSRIEKLGYGVESSRTEYAITGMTCASCANRIEKKVSKLEGVQSVSVSLPLERAYVEYFAETIDTTRIEKAVQSLGFEITADQSNALNGEKERSLLKTQMWLAILLSFPLFWAMADHFAFLDFIWVPGLFMNPWFQMALATPVQFAIGYRFYRNAFKAVKSGGTNMDLLVALGTSAAYFYSVYLTYDSLSYYANHVRIADIEIIIMMVIFVGFIFMYLNSSKKHLAIDMPIIGIATIGYLFTYYTSLSLENPHELDMPDLYFETSAVLITLILVGKVLESKAKKRSNTAVKKLINNQAVHATVIKNEQHVKVEIKDLALGDTVLVKPGERIPIDGKVMAGIPVINESVITGESIPAEKNQGDNVYCGTMNQNTTFTMQAAPSSEGNVIDQIIKIVENAQLSKAPIQRFADKVSSYFVPMVILMALATFMIWYFYVAPYDFTRSIHSFIAVLVISCPCALGLATPVSIMTGTGRAAELGILFKGGEHLESARKVDTIVLDKTGTITKGQPVLSKYKSTGAFADKEWLSIVANAEKHSGHPIAEAVVDGLKAEDLINISVEDIDTLPGFGLQANSPAGKVLIGNRTLMYQHNIVVNESLEQEIKADENKGLTSFFVSINHKIAGYLCLEDAIREDSAEVIGSLKKSGYKTIMLTGDNENAARSIADKTGIDSYRANVIPTEKADEIKKLQSSGAVVAMVGDGINDAPALATADTGIAIGSGTDLAIETSDITLLSNSLEKIPKALNVSKKTMRNIRQNLFWALIYNVIGIPFAAMGFLAPELAGAAMAFSSLSVVLNALRLQFYK